MPTDANVLGNVFGGAIMRYMDEIAAIVAWKHAGMNCVTASIDRMNFYAPVYVGNVLILKASVNYVGTTSMEVWVRITAEAMHDGGPRTVAEAFVTMVAVDRSGRPVEVPSLELRTDEERRRFDEGRRRMEARRAARAGTLPSSSARAAEEPR